MMEAIYSPNGGPCQRRVYTSSTEADPNAVLPTDCPRDNDTYLVFDDDGAAVGFWKYVVSMGAWVEVPVAVALQTTGLTPVVYTQGGFVPAQADLDNTVADLVELADGTRIDHGKVAWPAHGLTVGAWYFLSETAAGGYTDAPPAEGILQRLWFVEDKNTVHIDVEEAVLVAPPVEATGSLSRVLETPTDLTIASWAAPWTPTPISALDIEVPAGKWLSAEYVLKVSTANSSASISLRNRGHVVGTDNMTGVVDIPAFVSLQTAATGANWYKLLLTDTVFDFQANTPRQVNTSIGPIADTRVIVRIRWKNNAAVAKTFGWDFGADGAAAVSGIQLRVAAGSSVVYSIM